MTDATTSATRPSATTGLGTSRKGPACVQWVFPVPAVSILEGRHTIGREASCDTVLKGNEISRRHAEFRSEGSVTCIVDLDSSNGIYVNGNRVSREFLSLNDVIRCGEWIGIVRGNDCAGEFREIAPGWFGGSELFGAVEPVSRVRSDLPIIIQGETGTGKECVAQAVHRWSGRGGAFVAVNCATLPEQLAESELFGHKKGAFSGAEKPSLGLFRAAESGTLFLDEILELPRALQAKLLRAIELKEVLPIGETKPVAVDVRFVVAAQESLSGAVNDGAFRADLHARLDGLTIVLPPLRARRADIVPLALEFVRRHAQGRSITLEPKLVEALCLYDWPLNVRELSLLMRQLVELYGLESMLKRSHLPDRILGSARSPQRTEPREPGKRTWLSTKDDAQFEAFVAALREHKGSVAKAAEAVGITRARAYRLLSARPEFSLDEVKKKH